ncbi:MAG: hypothetical protein IT355_00525 [Gemmatimonadaceae bacterium]|nr:hypothetical protein [Gemmatimonadaceae bacterium]
MMTRTWMLGIAAAALVAGHEAATAHAAARPVLRLRRLVPLVDDSLLGHSRKLRARFLPAPAARELTAALDEIRADLAADAPRDGVASLQVLPIVPFHSKVDGWMGMYRMGFWPGEQGTVRGAAYGNPSGFIEVTPANRDLRVSEHFRLRDFVTKDQAAVWPKYLVLREPLLDKLELVIDELQSMGYPARRLQVMSGFRHPFYNDQGVGRGGRARESRHQYGDASDVFVDDDGDGRMDDLDGDGRITVLDADLLVLAVERVEMAHPELTGGMGRYHATHAHGPFVHIDVRGNPSRWGGA